MHTELKKTIVNFIFDNEKEFQINNATTNKFRAYIYDTEGNYLIGGQEVSEFISNAIKLLIRQTMKTLIAGTVCFILTCVWIETSTEKSPVALLYLAISLFLILKGYLKLMHDLVKKEQEEYEQERRTKSR